MIRCIVENSYIYNEVWLNLDTLAVFQLLYTLLKTFMECIEHSHFQGMLEDIGSHACRWIPGLYDFHTLGKLNMFMENGNL